MARPAGSQNKDKPFRDALKMEAALAEKGDPTPAPEGSLRWIARQLLVRAGAETSAAKEVGDRLDGKPAQAVEMSGSLGISHEEALNELDDGGNGTATNEPAGTGNPPAA
jgi:hypothetical protein